MSISARSRPRNPRGSGMQLREDIVRAARELLIETGTESSVTLRAVARTVGIAAPSIYAHFDSSEQIVAAVVGETFAVLQARIEDARRTAPTPRDRLLAGCRAYMAFGAEQPALYGVLFTRHRRPRRDVAQAQEPQVADLAGRGAFELLMQDVRESIEDGSSSATRVLDTAVQIWVGMHGLVMLRADEPEFPWPDDDRTETELVTQLGRLVECS